MLPAAAVPLLSPNRVITMLCIVQSRNKKALSAPSLEDEEAFPDFGGSAAAPVPCRPPLHSREHCARIVVLRFSRVGTSRVAWAPTRHVAATT